jgi:hypothetical protein
VWSVSECCRFGGSPGRRFNSTDQAVDLYRVGQGEFRQRRIYLMALGQFVSHTWTSPSVGIAISGPAEFLYDPSGVQYFRQVSCLVCLEIHDIDVVRYCAFASWWGGREHLIRTDAVSPVLSGGRQPPRSGRQAHAADVHHFVVEACHFRSPLQLPKPPRHSRETWGLIDAIALLSAGRN